MKLASRFSLVLFFALIGCGGAQIDIDENFYVSSTSPSHGATDVNPLAILQVGFNTAVADRTLESLTLSLEEGANLTDVPFTLQSAEGRKLLILTPDAPLLAGVHRFVIAGSAESQEGLALGADVTTRFTVIKPASE